MESYHVFINFLFTFCNLITVVITVLTINDKQLPQGPAF